MLRNTVIQCLNRHFVVSRLLAVLEQTLCSLITVIVQSACRTLSNAV